MKKKIRSDTFSDSNSVGPWHAENQDSFIAENPIFAVADGVGGYAGAKDASSLAISTLKKNSARIVDEESMKSVLHQIHEEVQRAAHKKRILNMGTTLAAAKIISDDQVILGNVGDSQILFINSKGAKQVSYDDSHRSEDPTAVYGITQYLGLDMEIEVHVSTISYESGDHLLICSDGVTDNLNLSTLGNLLRKQASAERIVREAIDGGVKPDDMTAVVISFQA